MSIQRTLKRTITAIRHFLDKFPGPRELLIFGATHGKWYVLYTDGYRTHRMYYHTARDYADIFGGEVYHVDYHKKESSAQPAYSNPEGMNRQPHGEAL